MAFLPQAIWARRLENERAELSKSGEKFSVNPDNTEYELIITGAGLCKQDGEIRPCLNHKVRVKLLRNYPYAGGIEVTWLTPIFHPNIRAEDGRVCIQLLNNWGATQSVASLAKGLRQLLENPNPLDPLDHEAAEYFANGAALPKHLHQGRQGGPKIVA